MLAPHWSKGLFGPYKRKPRARRGFVFSEALFGSMAIVAGGELRPAVDP